MLYSTGHVALIEIVLGLPANVTGGLIFQYGVLSWYGGWFIVSKKITFVQTKWY